MHILIYINIKFNFHLTLLSKDNKYKLCVVTLLHHAAFYTKIEFIKYGYYSKVYRHTNLRNSN